MKSEELREKAQEAEELEELLDKAKLAETYITEVLGIIGDVSINEPYGWLSEIMSNLISEVESKLESL
tara:strand:- start:326 stop:529 length:204 start_codon:yes stop_codon:yes gene_type:complete